MVMGIKRGEMLDRGRKKLGRKKRVVGVERVRRGSNRDGDYVG